jgi:predicted transcriptional regulator
LRTEVKNYQKLIKEKRSLGELDHPDDSVINLKNASHLVTECWMDGNNVMGKLRVLNTPSGKILQELVKDGVSIGISSRGMGSVTESNGHTTVEDDFQLICFDMVSEPSTPGAFMMKEAKEYKNEVFTKADRINRLLNEVLEDETGDT